MVRILAACEQYPDDHRRTGQQGAKRLRAFVLLLRYRGMRIGDIAACATDQLEGERLFLYGHPHRFRDTFAVELLFLEETGFKTQKTDFSLRNAYIQMAVVARKATL